MTQQEKYYKQLSEIYLTENELHQETSTKIMQALGITIEMHSHLIKYLISNKETEESKSQAERLKLRTYVINSFYKVAGFNNEMQLIIKYKNRDIAKLQAENKALKDQIKGIQEWTS